MFPVTTSRDIIEKCHYDFGASVIMHGKDLDDAKKQAFTMIAEIGKGTYING